MSKQCGLSMNIETYGSNWLISLLHPMVLMNPSLLKIRLKQINLVSCFTCDLGIKQVNKIITGLNLTIQGKHTCLSVLHDPTRRAGSVFVHVCLYIKWFLF